MVSISEIAIVSENKNIIKLERINQEIVKITSKKKELQKSLQNKLRLNNLENYEENKTTNKGRKKVKKLGKIKPKNNRTKWTLSNSYIKIQNQLKEIQRKEKIKRKLYQQELSNKIVANGNIVVMEKISYKAWQQMFGRSILNSSPAQFKNILKEKCVNNGGDLIEYNTHNTALSQMCICGKKSKKELKERFHKCSCGVIQQRIYLVHI